MTNMCAGCWLLGTLLFASEDVLSALETAAQPPAPHPRQDFVALVKTACVLVHDTIAKATVQLVEDVKEPLAKQPRDDAAAVGLVRKFWNERLDVNSPASCMWSELVTAAHDIPGSEDMQQYTHASQQLCDKLAKLVCPG